MGYSFRLVARVLLYASSHRQDNTYHSLCYTSLGALAGTRNSSTGPPHEGSIRRPITPWANALTTELHLAPRQAYGSHADIVGAIYRSVMCFTTCTVGGFTSRLVHPHLSTGMHFLEMGSRRMPSLHTHIWPARSGFDWQSVRSSRLSPQDSSHS